MSELPLVIINEVKIPPLLRESKLKFKIMNNYELKQQRERELFSKNIYEMDEYELNVIEMDLEQLIREDYSFTREDEMEQQVFQMLDEVKRLNGTKPHGTEDDLTYLLN